jgi:hypothetical protein
MEALPPQYTGQEGRTEPGSFFGGLWAKHMGLKRGAVGNILRTRWEPIGNLKGTFWEQRKNEINPYPPPKENKTNPGTLSAC